MEELRHVRKWTNKSYTLGEEIFNSVAHGVGALLAVVGSSVLLVFAGLSRDPWIIVGSVIYGVCLIMLYTMSTLYHSFTHEKVKELFRVFDHCSVFLLIAGTYTPFTLVTLRGGIGWALFGVIWGATLLGIILNAVNLEKFKRFSLICYLGMGWAVVFAFRPLIENMPINGLILLALGGMFYTVGVIFYKMKKLKYAHSVWHLFVLAGSIMHYFCILFYDALV